MVCPQKAAFNILMESRKPFTHVTIHTFTSAEHSAAHLTRDCPQTAPTNQVQPGSWPHKLSFFCFFFHLPFSVAARVSGYRQRRAGRRLVGSCVADS